MNWAQRNIIAMLMSYGNDFSWSQPGDYGDDVTIYRDYTVERNYDNIMRIVSKATCVVVEFCEGNDWYPNDVESFSFECRYPTNHYSHYATRCWHNDAGEIVPYETGEIADLGRAFADAFGLPIRYHREESK